ncbi:MAG: transporter substrate-binding domain-containing protein [Oceanospirillaceae bacterium]|nr:transporter substrate-binding domain-containing protein [Oceanospirillaceae bacterium]
MVVFSKWLSLLCVLCSCSSLMAGALRVGMPVPGQVPFLWVDDTGAVTGIYADTLRAVASDLKLQFKFVPLSQARLNRHFLGGEIDLELGVSDSADEPQAIRVLSVFSRPFGFANEVVVFNPKLRFPAFILKDLKNIKVAVVRGASTPDYIIREDYASPLQIAMRVDRGWSEVGLMREATAVHYQTNQAMSYKISLPYASNPISIRLHRQHQYLLEKINNSIEKLERQGVLEDIICKYLCGN